MLRPGDGCEAQSIHLWTHKGSSAATCLPLPCRQDRSSGTGGAQHGGSTADACCRKLGAPKYPGLSICTYMYVICCIDMARTGGILHVQTHQRGVGWGWSKFVMLSLRPWMLMTSSWRVSYNSSHRGRFGWGRLASLVATPMHPGALWNLCLFHEFVSS